MELLYDVGTFLLLFCECENVYVRMYVQYVYVYEVHMNNEQCAM